MNGQVPCRDFYCPSAPLTYFLQALVLPAGIMGMKLYLALQATITLIVTAWFLHVVLKVKPIHMAMILPVSVAWLPGFQHMIPWYDVDAGFFCFLTLCALGASYFYSKYHYLILAGTMAGLSLLSKQNIGGACFIASICFIAVQDFDLKGRIKQGMAFILGFAVPLGLLAGYFAYNGALHDAWVWLVQRAAERYGEGKLISTMFTSLYLIVFGNQNNFSKFLLIFYGWAIYATWQDRKDVAGWRVRFGAAIFCLVALLLSIVHMRGNCFPTHQMYLGVVLGLLFTSTSLRHTFLILVPCMVLMLLFGATYNWRRPYTQGSIAFTPDNARLKGMYFRKEDCDAVNELLDFEKTIPAGEKVMVMPDPLFFYYATGRMSPVPMTHFGVSGWELNDIEKELIPARLKQNDVKWVIVGRESYYNSGFLNFDLKGKWKSNPTAMMSRGDYTNFRTYVDENYHEVCNLKYFWVLRRNLL